MGKREKKDMGSSRTQEGNSDHLLDKNWTGVYVWGPCRILLRLFGKVNLVLARRLYTDAIWTWLSAAETASGAREYRTALKDVQIKATF